MWSFNREQMTTPDIGVPLGLASLGNHMGGRNGDPLALALAVLPWSCRRLTVCSWLGMPTVAMPYQLRGESFNWSFVLLYIHGYKVSLIQLCSHVCLLNWESSKDWVLSSYAGRFALASGQRLGAYAGNIGCLCRTSYHCTLCLRTVLTGFGSHTELLYFCTLSWMKVISDFPYIITVNWNHETYFL
jgi:hypothetical protein